MTAQQSQQMLLQQLQGMMGQMAGLMQQASVLAPQPDVASAAVSEQPAPPIPTCKKEFHKVKQVRGIEGAKEEQAKLMNGESDIVMDEDDPVFYMIMLQDKYDALLEKYNSEKIDNSNERQTNTILNTLLSTMGKWVANAPAAAA